MILIAVMLLACFPPGFLFPQMAERMGGLRREKRRQRKAAKAAEKNTTGGTEENLEMGNARPESEQGSHGTS